MYSCPTCGRVYHKLTNLRRHIHATHLALTTCSCAQCGKTFRRVDNMQRHSATCTGHLVQQGGAIRQRPPPIDFTIDTPSCSTSSSSTSTSATATRPFQPQKTSSTFHNTTSTYTTVINSPHLDLLQDAITALLPTLTQQRQALRNIKFNVSIQVVFHKAVDTSITTKPPVTLTSEPHTAYATT